MTLHRVCCALLLALMACGGATEESSPPPPRENPVPALLRVTPETLIVGSGATELLLTGSGFTTSSQVQLDGLDHASVYSNATQLRLTLTEQELATTRIAKLSITNPTPGGGQSSSLPLAVVYPKPVIGAVSPAGAFVDDGRVNIVVDGSGFAPASVIQWGGQPLATTFETSRRLSAEVTGSLLERAGAISVTVSTPEPGGGTSGAMPFTIAVPKPILTAISPTNVVASTPFTLTATGSHFVQGAVIRFNGLSRSTTYVDAGMLRVDLSAADATQPGNVGITVSNPNGGDSDPLTLRIAAHVPQIASLSPTGTATGGNAFTLSVIGAYFGPGMVVRWNGQARTTQLLSGGLLTAAITSQDIAAAGNASITVFNPTTGDVSNAATFAVVAPAGLSLSSLSPTNTVAGTGFVLTVQGNGFVQNNSIIEWNGKGQWTNFLSPTSLSSAIDGSDAASPGSATVTVRNTSTGQVSNALPFTITPAPVPVVTSVSPSTAFAGSTNVTFSVTGSNFASGMWVSWNGTDLQTTWVSPTAMSATATWSQLLYPGTGAITVRNATTGQVSNSVPFTVTALPPTSGIPTSIDLNSDAGEVTGLGQSYSYNQANSLILVNTTGGFVSFSIQGDERWLGSFTMPSGSTQLAAGTYTTGRLTWSNGTHICPSTSGSFTIQSATYSAGTLVGFDAQFEQHCNGTAPALHGVVHWHLDDATRPAGPMNPIPATLWQPAAGALPNATRFIYLQSDPGDWYGGKTTVLASPSSPLSLDVGSQVVATAPEWSLRFVPMLGLSQPAIGYYPGLHQWGALDYNPAKGGLSVSYAATTCSGLTGWFVVDNIALSGQTVTALDLRFEARCPLGTGVLHGVIHWR